ncbi:MAG: putative ABC transporter permease, partial [Clostridium celatum]|nr:putative ABC transporter permease [Clostridium celatum]
MHIYTLHKWLLLFYLYCFIGWIWESCYVSLKKHKWINRGFLKGPLLPIYGSGAVVVLISTLTVENNLLLVFVIGMISATILEYITGVAMEKLFHVRYWDYSKE